MGPVELICLYICVSICLSLCLVVRVAFCSSKCSVHKCVQRMRPQTTGSNPLICSTIYLFVCPSVCPVACGLFAFFVFVLISSVGFHRTDEITPTLGTGRHQWGPVKLIFYSVSMNLSISSRTRQFLEIIKARPVIAHIVCGLRPQVQTPSVAV